VKVGVPKESAEGERRVAIVPEVATKLGQRGVDVVVEPGAGEAAHFADSAYAEAGASSGAPWDADVLAKVAPPTDEEIARLRQGAVLIGFLEPLTAPDRARALASAGVTAFAMELIPRITRAQSMDALSSQSTVSGYRAALIGAQHLDRFLPMLTTAAGTVRPARVLVLGAGVAGLQAIATSKRLGAIVTAFDVPKAVKEQNESLGAKFLDLELDTDAEAAGGYARQLTEEEQQAQRDALGRNMANIDIVISTALVPGKPAPLLITADAVKGMKPGSVIVDLAGESGGNCELTEPGRTVVKEDVTIVSPTNLPSTMADHASQLYAKNVQSLLELMLDEDGNLSLDWDDEVIKGACLTHEGEIRAGAAAPSQ
jgi:NAD(P) transhydrogenase subunit alpha